MIFYSLDDMSSNYLQVYYISISIASQMDFPNQTETQQEQNEMQPMERFHTALPSIPQDYLQSIMGKAIDEVRILRFIYSYEEADSGKCLRQQILALCREESQRQAFSFFEHQHGYQHEKLNFFKKRLDMAVNHSNKIVFFPTSITTEMFHAIFDCTRQTPTLVEGQKGCGKTFGVITALALTKNVILLKLLSKSLPQLHIPASITEFSQKVGKVIYISSLKLARASITSTICQQCAQIKIDEKGIPDLNLFIHKLVNTYHYFNIDVIFVLDSLNQYYSDLRNHINRMKQSKQIVSEILKNEKETIQQLNHMSRLLKIFCQMINRYRNARVILISSCNLQQTLFRDEEIDTRYYDPLGNHEGVNKMQISFSQKLIDQAGQQQMRKICEFQLQRALQVLDPQDDQKSQKERVREAWRKMTISNWHYNAKFLKVRQFMDEAKAQALENKGQNRIGIFEDYLINHSQSLNKIDQNKESLSLKQFITKDINFLDRSTKTLRISFIKFFRQIASKCYQDKLIRVDLKPLLQFHKQMSPQQTLDQSRLEDIKDHIIYNSYTRVTYKEVLIFIPAKDYLKITQFIQVDFFQMFRDGQLLYKPSITRDTIGRSLESSMISILTSSKLIMQFNDKKQELVINNPSQLCSFTHFLGKDYNIVDRFDSAFRFLTDTQSKAWVGCIPITNKRNQSPNGGYIDFALLKKQESQSTYTLKTLDFTVSKKIESLKKKARRYIEFFKEILDQNQFPVWNNSPISIQYSHVIMCPNEITSDLTQAIGDMVHELHSHANIACVGIQTVTFPQLSRPLREIYESALLLVKETNCSRKIFDRDVIQQRKPKEGNQSKDQIQQAHSRSRSKQKRTLRSSNKKKK